MSSDPSLQTLWCQNSGMVNLYINAQLAVELPPALCAQLEKDLAAARRVPERAARMVGGPISSSMSDCSTDFSAWGGDPDCAAGDAEASNNA